MNWILKCIIIVIICFVSPIIARILPIELRYLIGYIAGFINAMLIFSGGNNNGNKN